MGFAAPAPSVRSRSTHAFGRALLAMLCTLLCGLAVLQAPAQAATGSLSGRVSEGGGASLSGAVVQLFTGPIKVAEATSGADGNYSISVDNGTYDIVVEPPAGSVFTVSHYNAFTVSGPTNLNIVLVRQSVTFSGVLRTSKGMPIPNVTLRLTGPSLASTNDLIVGRASPWRWRRGPTRSPSPCAANPSPDYPVLLLRRPQ